MGWKEEEAGKRLARRRDGLTGLDRRDEGNFFQGLSVLPKFLGSLLVSTCVLFFVCWILGIFSAPCGKGKKG